MNGIAVDWTSNNVYTTDALYNWIMLTTIKDATNMDAYFNILIDNDLELPYGIAVHPGKR